MKQLLLFILAVGALASCAPKKYAYHFDKHNYYAGKKNAQMEQVQQQIVAAEMEVQEQQLAVAPQELQANSEPVAAPAQNQLLNKVQAISEKYEARKDAPAADAKALRKELKQDLKDLKKEIKKHSKEELAPNKADEAKAMDKNLKIGLILLIAAALTTWIFWPLGAALWIAGLIFLIMWLVEQ